MFSPAIFRLRRRLGVNQLLSLSCHDGREAVIRKGHTLRRKTATRLAGAALLAMATPLLLGAVGSYRDLDQRLLASHNRERSQLGIAPLRWSDALAADAREWADALAASGRFEHSLPRGADPQGENLWRGTRGYYEPEAMVGLWLAERRDFVDGVFPANSRTGRVQDVGHYTQIIWRETSAVGCALSRGRQHDVLVCRYSKPGNIRGRAPI